MGRTSYTVHFERDLKRGRGSGADSDYQPYLRIQDVPSEAIRYRQPLLRFNRIFHLMSYGERAALLQFDWNPRVECIYEQVALDPKRTILLSQEAGIRHPSVRGETVVMTTDFLVCFRQECGVHWVACQIKHDQGDLANERTQEKLLLEKMYWKSRKIDYRCVLASTFNKIFVRNLEMLSSLRNSRRLPVGMNEVDKGIEAVIKANPQERLLCTLSGRGGGTILSDWEMIKIGVSRKIWELPIKEKPLERCRVKDLQRKRDD